MRRSNFTTAFYEIAYNEKASIIFTTKHEDKITLNPVTIHTSKNGFSIISIEYNLQLTLLKGISLDWMPWLTLEGCDEKVGN